VHSCRISIFLKERGVCKTSKNENVAVQEIMAVGKAFCLQNLNPNRWGF